MLITKFKALKNTEFYAKVCDITNRAFAFDEEYSNAKLVKKTKKSKHKAKKNVALQIAGRIIIEGETTIEDLQEQLALLNQNFNKAFKKLTVKIG
ncbi:hypothetical protein Godav_016040, partial [Gossypium davidsonii]|nr:hypothetical protein [Gossypium davidsonii]